MSVVVYFVRERGAGLPRWRYLVLPVIGAAVDIYLLAHLASDALIVGLSWAAIGFLYLLWLTRGLTRQPPDLAGAAERG